MAPWFVPRSRARIAVGATVMRLAKRPLFAGLASRSLVGA
jgi:hypothetical protein